MKRVATKPTARPAAKKAAAQGTASAAAGASDVDARIRDLPDWQARSMSDLRALIKSAAPDVVEEVKWRKPSNAMKGVPTWSVDGLICTGEPYKDKLKFTFAKGAALPDPNKVFNGNDTGATRRSLDVHEGDKVDAAAFKALVKAAAKLNAS